MSGTRALNLETGCADVIPKSQCVTIDGKISNNYVRIFSELIYFMGVRD